MNVSFDSYIRNLEKLSEEDLLHICDDAYNNEISPGIIGEAGALRNSSIFLLRHTWSTPAIYHRLSVCKLCYVYRGHFRLYTEDGTYTPLSKGDLCIVPPLVLQKVTADFEYLSAEPHSRNILFNVMFSIHEAARLLSPLLSGKLAVSDYLNQMLYGKDCPKFMILHGANEDTCFAAQKLFYEIDRYNDESREKVNPHDSIGIMLLLNLFLLSYDRDGQTSYTHSSSHIGKISPAAQIMDYIRVHFATVTLEELCDRFHYTPSHICKLIRKYTGLSFKENLTNEKMRYACFELSQTEKPVDDILAESGYGTKEYFYRAFKKHCGMTPGEYRKRYFRPPIAK